MSEIENKLRDLGIHLEAPRSPVANYLGTRRVGDLLFVSGRKSDLAGAVGGDITEDQARQAARDTVTLLLSIIKRDVGDLDLIEGVVKLQGFIRSAPGFMNQPQVLDGASELLIELFGEKGRHARTATGVSELPFGATIQLDMVLNMKSPESR